MSVEDFLNKNLGKINAFFNKYPTTIIFLIFVLGLVAMCYAAWSNPNLWK